MEEPLPTSIRFRRFYDGNKHHEEDTFVRLSILQKPSSDLIKFSKRILYQYLWSSLQFNKNCLSNKPHVLKNVKEFRQCFRYFSPILVKLDTANFNVMVLNNWELHRNLCSEVLPHLSALIKFCLYFLYFLLYLDETSTQERSTFIL